MVEEQGLFPAWPGSSPSRSRRWSAEHRSIEAVLAEAAAGTPADPTWPDRLLARARLLREHILKEQDGVFPAALAALGSEEWERIEGMRARVGTALPTTLHHHGQA